MKARDLSRSWEANAKLWTSAVRERTIESRRVTDAALLAAIHRLAPHRLLDLGCGEGWLVRHLFSEGIEATGIDGSSALIGEARKLGQGRFLQLSYADFAATPERAGAPFDCIVANFALLEEELLALLAACRQALEPKGRLIIQTLHPRSQPGLYRDGWREEDFAAMGQGAWQTMPWYFRTLSSWFSLLQEGGFSLMALEEPRHPEQGQPLSLLLGAVPIDRLRAKPRCPTSRDSDQRPTSDL